MGLAKEYEAVAKLTGCYYLDANEVVTVPPNDIDHMHLTKEGHSQLASGITRKIMEII